MSFAKKLCDLMEKEHISSYKLAKDIGVHVSTVTNWREGKPITVDKIVSVAKHFDVTVDELLKED
ncbi:MAG: helix-turn-helix transcriptional regulator [Clostridia bacterium]|nr:helix-turn-helix transcriptional regulator [Clostridia bacterium]